MKTRGFEVVKGYEDKGINLPKRQTLNAAGYDFEASEDIVVPSFIACFTEMSSITDHYADIATKILDSMEDDSIILEKLQNFNEKVENMQKEFDGFLSEELQTEYIEIIKEILEEDDSEQFTKYFDVLKKGTKPTLIPTGIKAYMLEDEKLDLYNRSSGPIKNDLVMTNGVGLIDSDYYENESNDGHIFFQFINYGKAALLIKKGDRIGQGVFTKFLKVDNDDASGERKGGHGSTN